MPSLCDASTPLTQSLVAELLDGSPYPSRKDDRRKRSVIAVVPRHHTALPFVSGKYVWPLVWQEGAGLKQRPVAKLGRC